MTQSEKLFAGILAVAAVGITLAIVLAPPPGKAAMGIIGKKSKKSSKEALDTAIGFLENLREKYNDTVDAKAKLGKAAIEGIKDTIKL